MSKPKPHSEIARALNASDGSNAVRAFCFALPGGGEVPEWIPYLPAPDANGRVLGEDGRAWIVRDMRALASAVKRKLPIDENHSTDLQAKQGLPAPAFGFITEFQVRDDGSLWAKPKWNARGRNAMQGEDYGFISPFFDFDRKTGVVTRLAGASLVNEPNFESMPALNSRNPEETPMLKALLALLGLTEGVTQEEAERAINNLKSERDRALNARDTPDLTRFVPRGDYEALKERADNAVQQLKDRDEADLKARVDAAIDAALKAGKIPPSGAEYHRANCMREGNTTAFDAYVSSAPAIVEDPTKQQRNPATGGNGALTADERAMCSRMGVAEADYLKTRDAK